MTIKEITEKMSNEVFKLLDAFTKDDRVAIIDELIHRLQFERRLTLLTPSQLTSMHRVLSPEALKRLDECKTEDEREEYITQYARAHYFRQCAWVDYLNGAIDEPPCS